MEARVLRQYCVVHFMNKLFAHNKANCTLWIYIFTHVEIVVTFYPVKIYENHNRFKLKKCLAKIQGVFCHIILQSHAFALFTPDVAKQTPFVLVGSPQQASNSTHSSTPALKFLFQETMFFSILPHYTCSLR